MTLPERSSQSCLTFFHHPLTFDGMIVRIQFLPVAICVSICLSLASGQVLRPDPSLGYVAHVPVNASWGGIYTRSMGEDRTLVLQIYDLTHCSMDVLLFGVATMGNGDGRYNTNHVNPYFRKVAPESAWATYTRVYGENVLSVSNGVFFEAPTESLLTQLAFPVQVGGVLVSAGGSPTGVASNKYPLQVFQIGESTAAVSPYDPVHDVALADQRYPDQLVTLNYRNHPNVKEYPTTPEGVKNSYHLITLVKDPLQQARSTVLVISSNYAISIYALARELKRVCRDVSDDDILTLDGGSSISVVDGKGKALVKTGPSVRVPLFVGFRLKGSAASRALCIMNPMDDDVVTQHGPYFAFYYSSAGRVVFGLMRHGIPCMKFGNDADARDRGVFVWDPATCAPGQSYRLTIRSSSGSEASSGEFVVRP
jgi:hypothetical protein